MVDGPLRLRPDTLERMVRAVEKVAERLRRAAGALDRAGVPYAVIGGNAVAAWVAQVDEAAVRNTRDVDILLRGEDVEAARQALEQVGFVYREVAGIRMFLDGADAKPHDAVHAVMAARKVRPEYPLPTPDVTEAVRNDGFSVLSLDALVRMKLTSWRDKDRMHLRDLLSVGLLTPDRCQNVPQVLTERLQHILDTPEG